MYLKIAISVCHFIVALGAYVELDWIIGAGIGKQRR